MNNLFDLTGKTAIVTGGNGGIGKAIAMALASQGASIAIAARNTQKTADTVTEIKENYGVHVRGFEVDITAEESVTSMVRNLLDVFGGINILVNNSGIALGKKPEDITLDEWDRVINTNLRGAFLTAKAVYPTFKSNRSGKIINIGSMASILGSGLLPAYGSSKGGIVQLTRSLAVAWAPDNIQANAILPGWFKTDLGEKARQENPDHERRVAELTPAGRWGETSELGGTAIFLASAASNFVTGIAVPVDGGYSIAINGMDGPFYPQK